MGSTRASSTRLDPSSAANDLVEMALKVLLSRPAVACIAFVGEGCVLEVRDPISLFGSVESGKGEITLGTKVT